MARRIFSIGPAITLRGRTFKGLRGWAGKPLHPPLTDIPVAAYVLVAAFDLFAYLVVSFLEDNTTLVELAPDAYRAGTWVIVAGAVVGLGAALTGFWDWLRSTPKYTQAWRTANFHMAVMLTVTAIVIVDIVLRLRAYDAVAPSGFVTALSVVAGALVAFGATYGGSLAFDYGFNVETSGDHPVWHESERDVYPTDPHAPND